MISDQLVRLRTWHFRIQQYIADAQFTPLPDTLATNPYFTSEDIVEARAWFLNEFGRKQGRAENSRFMRYALQCLTNET